MYFVFFFKLLKVCIHLLYNQLIFSEEVLENYHISCLILCIIILYQRGGRQWPTQRDGQLSPVMGEGFCVGEAPWWRSFTGAQSLVALILSR